MQQTPNTQTAASLVAPAFHEGDHVYLAKGFYQGTTGTFLHLRDDPKWADILEANSAVRAHPVEWLRIVRLSSEPRRISPVTGSRSSNFWRAAKAR